ncbi:MAG: LegC family aminotransferase [Erysipelotrichaceae bacterium]
MNKFIPLSVPNIKGNERKYVDEALESEWVSSGGPHITKFEDKFKEYLNVSAACACQSGTAGLHLCLVTLGITENDIVLVPTLTFIATINAVMYQKATPVFFDCDDSLGINVKDIKFYLDTKCKRENNRIIELSSNKEVKAIIPVHVFGNTCNMEELMEIAKEYKLFVIEDATESLGTNYIEGKYKGKDTGTIGDFGVFSFNGNKLITTGGGGMVVSDNVEYIDKIRYFSTQSKDDAVYFVHNNIGYNYRLTNVQAAIGLGQLEQIQKFIKQKKENYLYYKDLLKNSKLGYILDFDEKTNPNFWFYSYVLCKPNSEIRDKLINYLTENNVQTRPIWKLNHTQKPFMKFDFYGENTALKYYNSIINLPCSTNLTKDEVRIVANLILEFEKSIL